MSTATPPQSPPTPAPTPAPEPSGSVESWLRPARVVWVLVAGALGFGGTGAAAYYGATGKLERVAERVEQVDANVEKYREEAERRAREQQQAADKRFAEMDAQRKEDEAKRQKDREELIGIRFALDALQKASTEQRGDMKVLLDRLNAPRVRTVRDFPQ